MEVTHSTPGWTSNIKELKSSLPPSVISNSLLKKALYAGCSKMPRYEAPEILMSEAYLDVRRNDEG
jgi:hypothetical protein